ncbi:hypothetical protein SY83_21060 [Paenibacillus swuensis]|uniref:Uncharacterized protein n=1 Tax=Paenibacillus swuensis TaxID=1178515 RepID=A0A172TN08_9BACL|nr:hypothetical protein SY83_21060 [Paenibacillus swuensis]
MFRYFAQYAHLDFIVRATRNSHYVFVIGFVLAMAALLMDLSPSLMFMMLFLSGFVSKIIGVTTQL